MVESNEYLIKLYSKAENDLLREINRALLKGNQTAYLQTMLKNTKAILEDLESGSRKWCEKAIPDYYLEGAQLGVDMLEDAGKADLITGFGAIHQQAAQVLAEAAFGRFDDVNKVIGRRVNDIYRTMAMEKIRGNVIGYESWQKTARNYRNALADEGITGFTDKSGRKWNMRAYSEMVARTTGMEAKNQGTANRLLENGEDLVKISTHAGACEKCKPWEGKILSLSGQTEGYKTLDDAKRAGLFHPRCGHSFGLYIDIKAQTAANEKWLKDNP